MTTHSVTIYSRLCCPRDVALLASSLSPHCRVVGRPDAWTEISINTYSGLLRRKKSLTIRHEPHRYVGDSWNAERGRLEDEFARLPVDDKRDLILRTIGTFEFALTAEFDPEAEFGSRDERLWYLYSIVKGIDGVIYTPSVLRDNRGRVLIGQNCDPESGGELPKVLARVEISPNAADGEDAEYQENLNPPSHERVIARALALAAVTNRALLEQDSKKRAANKVWKQNLEWIDKAGIGDELEPDEWAIVQRPLGKANRQDAVNSTWRLEGLAVLAWALQRFNLPSYDQLVVPTELLGAVEYGAPDAASKLAEHSTLRIVDQLEAFREQMFALHWRLRNYGLRPEHMDFAEFARTAWFGPLDIGFARLIQSDLALGRWPISQAPAELREQCLSTAMERHLASNWLCGSSLIYSETDTST